MPPRAWRAADDSPAGGRAKGTVRAMATVIDRQDGYHLIRCRLQRSGWSVIVYEGHRWSPGHPDHGAGRGVLGRYPRLAEAIDAARAMLASREGPRLCNWRDVSEVRRAMIDQRPAVPAGRAKP